MDKTFIDKLRERDLDAFGRLFYILGNKTPHNIRKYYKFKRMGGIDRPNEKDLNKSIETAIEMYRRRYD